jgi:hypothetical protein
VAATDCIRYDPSTAPKMSWINFISQQLSSKSGWAVSSSGILGQVRENEKKNLKIDAN